MINSDFIIKKIYFEKYPGFSKIPNIFILSKEGLITKEKIVSAIVNENLLITSDGKYASRSFLEDTIFSLEAIILFDLCVFSDYDEMCLNYILNLGKYNDMSVSIEDVIIKSVEKLWEDNSVRAVKAKKNQILLVIK
jgi:hypothetical protein